MGTDTRILLQTFLVGMRDYFGDTERGTSVYEVFLNTLVDTSWNACRRHSCQVEGCN